MRHSLVVGAGAAAALVALPWLPRHLDAHGTSLLMKALVAFFLPVTALVVHVLWRSLLAKTAVRPDDEAAKTILWCVTLFLITLHALLIGALLDVGRAFAGRAAIVALGLTLVVVGNVLPRLGPNLALGIRTRRALSNRQVWLATHRAAGYAVVVIGLAAAIAGVFLRGPAMPAVVMLAVAGGAAAVAVAYRKATRGLELPAES